MHGDFPRTINGENKNNQQQTNTGLCDRRRASRGSRCGWGGHQKPQGSAPLPGPDL